jgi:protein-tyrosine-phosphatase
VEAARRHGLDLGEDPTPRRLDSVARPALVVTVCDQAHEQLGEGVEAWHWSIVDPVPAGTMKAFDATVAELRQRIVGLVAP